ncbi:MAG: hypothetical protein ACK4IK_05725 [Bacteroidia bacterium]
MKLQLITEYPLWLIGLCLLTGAAYAFLLYYRERNLIDISKYLKLILLTFRFLAVSILAFLLLNPLLKSWTKTVEKPILIIAQDNSASILSNGDSAYYLNQYKIDLENFKNNLSDKFEIKQLLFGSNVREESEINYNDKQTDISELIRETENKFANRNIGALIIASDGIYNKGANPLYQPYKFKSPIYTVGLGDTTDKKDIILSKVYYNKIAYLGNSFPLEILSEVNKCKGCTFQLSIKKNGQQLFNKTIISDSEHFFSTTQVQLEAREKGLQRYSILLSRVEGEVTYDNNQQDIYIDVLDSRQKIALVASAPHPDIAAIKSAIEQNENYQVESFLINEFNKNLSEYNLAIFYQLPDISGNGLNLIEAAQKNNVPTLFILGLNVSYAQFNKLQTGVNVNALPGKSNEIQAIKNKNFTLFSGNESFNKVYAELPALSAPFGNIKYSNAFIPLFFQKIGMVETEEPIVLFNSQSEPKTGVIIAEGWWRWKLANYARYQNHDAFNEWIQKSVQFLSVKQEKNKFRVFTKNLFNENEPIEMEAELYNDAFELFNEPEVTINIFDSNKKRYPFTFVKTSNAYRLNAGFLPVGDYTYEAFVKYGDKILKQSGSFSISAIVIEQLNTKANHQLLYSLSEKHGGKLFLSAQLTELKDELLQREDLLPIAYSEQKLNELINLKWIFFLILTLLSIEWFIRKRFGGY